MTKEDVHVRKNGPSERALSLFEWREESDLIHTSFHLENIVEETTDENLIENCCGFSQYIFFF